MQQEKVKTTMSVPEMRKMLGLGKTEGYWLVHKRVFETMLVAGRMRIVLSSFEAWYANQIKYRKVSGPEPGLQLRKETLSAQDVAKLLAVNDDTVYELMKKNLFEIVIVNHQKRIPKLSFYQWYVNQSHYRLPDDRERDKETEEASMSLPEMGRLLGIDRNQAYQLVSCYDNQLKIITIADRKRVTKESFENWYANQDIFVKVADCVEPKPPKPLKKETERRPKPLPLPDENLFYSIQDTAQMLNLDERQVYRLIDYKDLRAKKIGTKWRVAGSEILQWQHQQTNEV